MIYFDNAATTKIKKEVLDEMMPYLKENFGNASSFYYKLGNISKVAIQNSREIIARTINANEREIYFTGSGTESDNFAIKGFMGANTKRGKHMITTSIEHHAVLHTCMYLEKKGFEVTYLKVDEFGKISLRELEDAIRPDTVLISIMFANNEIGTIEPIKEIGEIAKKYGICFHTDAVQAFGKVNIDVKELNIDIMSMSAHKLHGPKGVGAIYIKSGTKIENFMHGGAQENKRRASTENVAGIVGFAKAVEIALENMDENTKKMLEIREFLIEEISKIPHAHLNGHRTDRLAGNVNFSFNFIEGESILLRLSLKDIYVSSGSACTTGSLDPSHVLLALGLSHQIAHGSLRISLSEENTKEEAEYLLENLREAVEYLRRISALG